MGGDRRGTGCEVRGAVSSWGGGLAGCRGGVLVGLPSPESGNSS